MRRAEGRLAALAGSLLSAGALACGAPAGGELSGAGDWAGRPLAEPIPRPSFVLADVEGRPFDFRRETAGRVVLLFFGFTHCPDVCPVHMANLAAVLDDLPFEITRHVRVVFVTTDPERDTPERLRSWLREIHPSIVGLRGTPEEVNAIERSLGLPPSVVDPGVGGSDYFVGHAAQVLAFGADGPARLQYPWGTRQRDWLRDLRRLVEETREAEPEGAGGADRTGG